MIYSMIPNIDKHPLFTGVPISHISEYLTADVTRISEFTPNTVAYSSESETRQVAFILCGTAKVYMGNSEESAFMRTLTAGDAFGVANLYDEDDPFPSYIITASNVKILFIEGEIFKKFIECNSTATKNYLSFLSKKIVYLNKKLATLTAGSAEKKLACYILEHNTDRIFSPPSLCELADILQMGRASLYRAIDSLEENGMIERKGKKILVLDMEKLKNI